METGNSYYVNRKVCDKFLKWLHDLVQWQHNFDQIPSTIWRNIKKMIIIFMQCYVDGKMTQEWNKYWHSSSINDKDIKIVTVDTPESFTKMYNLNIGDRYWISPHGLLVVLSGDGIDIPHAPYHAKGAFALVKVHVLKHKHLQQTLMIAIPWLISGLSSYDPRIAEVYHQVSAALGKNGGLSFWSEKKQCKICTNWERKDGGDWVWLSSIVYRCLSHKGNFPFVYWVHHIGKQFVAVKKTPNKIFKAIKAGIKDEHLPWNLNLQSITEMDNFYCLATAYHHQQWANQVEEYIRGLRNLANLSYKQIHTKRRNYANKIHSPLLYKTPINMIQYVLDVMHDILRHSGHQIMVLVILCWCHFDFTIAEVIACLAHCCK